MKRMRQYIHRFFSYRIRREPTATTANVAIVEEPVAKEPVAKEPVAKETKKNDCVYDIRNFCTYNTNITLTATATAVFESPAYQQTIDEVYDLFQFDRDCPYEPTGNNDQFTKSNARILADFYRTAYDFDFKQKNRAKYRRIGKKGWRRVVWLPLCRAGSCLLIA